MSKNIRPRTKIGKCLDRKAMKKGKHSQDAAMKAIKVFILVFILMLIVVGKSVSFDVNATEKGIGSEEENTAEKATIGTKAAQEETSLHLNPEASPVSRSTATVTEYIATDKDGRIIQSIAGFAAAKYDDSKRKILVADEKTDINKAVEASKEADKIAEEEAAKEAAKAAESKAASEGKTDKEAEKQSADAEKKDENPEGKEEVAQEESSIDDSRYVLIQNASDVTDITGSINREFYTIKTASDKVFYLIIDKSGNENNVHFLTEISENDLLHTTETQVQPVSMNTGTNSGVKESALPNSNTGIFGNKTQASNGTESQAYQSEPSESLEDKKAESEAENKTGIVRDPEPLDADGEAAQKIERRKAIVKLVLGLLAIAGLILIYYFKFVLKKKENYSDDDGFGSAGDNWFDDDSRNDSDTVDFTARDVENDDEFWED